MQLSITGQNVDLTDAMKDYATEKLGRVKRHFDQVINAHVVLKHEKFRHIAEVTLHASGATFHAQSEDKDMYAAIDALGDKIDQQVRKHKEKNSNHAGPRHHGASL